jgi:hypothetical protein
MTWSPTQSWKPPAPSPSRRQRPRFGLGWCSWVFFLAPINEKTTRLIIRIRLVYEPNLSNVLMWRVFTDPITFVMERKMLQGIKVRAEAAASD